MSHQYINVYFCWSNMILMLWIDLRVNSIKFSCCKFAMTGFWKVSLFYVLGKLIQCRVTGFAHRQPNKEQLEVANPVRSDQTGLWQCPFCDKKDFPELSEVNALFAVFSSHQMYLTFSLHRFETYRKCVCSLCFHHQHYLHKHMLRLLTYTLINLLLGHFLLGLYMEFIQLKPWKSVVGSVYHTV